VTVTPTTTCDVAVIGGGAAGLTAATVSARAGAATVLVDAYTRAGGQYFRQPAPPRPAGSPAQAGGQRLIDAARQAGVELRLDTSVWDATPTALQLTTHDRLSSLEFRSLVVATGAHERVAAFDGWDLPGVYTAGGIQSLLKEHDVVPGERVLFVGSGPLPLVVAAALARRAVRVVGVLEAARPVTHGLRYPWLTASGLWGHGARVREGLASAVRLVRSRTPIRIGWGIVRALGRTRVEGAVVGPLDDDWRPIRGSERTVHCDTIAVHYGLVPSTEILRLVGARMRHRSEIGGWVPDRTDRLRTSVAGVYAAGDCAGIGGVGLSTVEGEIAGLEAASRALGRRPAGDRRAALARERRFQRLYGSLFGPRAGLADLAGPDTVVCRCEEVPRGDVDAAIAAGARTTAMVKSVTRCGMGSCQGRICLPLVEQITALATSAPTAPPPAARPPLVPIPFEAMRAC
jgi:D-hydroxyproline dehydrogenase subunit alpha